MIFKNVDKWITLNKREMKTITSIISIVQNAYFDRSFYTT